MSEFAYSVNSLPVGLSLNPLTGAITGTPTAAGAFSSTFTATAPTTSGTLLWAPGVLDNPIVLSGTFSGNQTLGTTATAPSIEATGYMVGTPVMSITAGALPPGMTIASGVPTWYLEGAPSSVGTFNFSVAVTDQSTPTPRSSGSVAQTVVIVDNPITLTGTLNNAVPNAAYSSTLTLGGYYVDTVTISASSGAIPSWMTVNISGATVTFSGTAPASGTFTFTPKATDSSTPTARTGTGASQTVNVVSLVTWTQSATPYVPNGGAVNGAMITLAENNGNTNRGMYSTNTGSSWTAMTFPVDQLATSMVYGAGLFVSAANGNGYFTSSDGITWTTRTTLPLAPNGYWGQPFFGGGMFVFPVFTNSGQSLTVLCTSTNGISWTQRTVPSGNWEYGAYGNSTFVIVSNSAGSAATSPDGITWTANSMSGAGSNSIAGLAFGNGVFVLGTDNGVATSVDGANWTLRSISGASGTMCVAFANGVFVAVPQLGRDGYAFASTDGTSWGQYTLPSTLTVQGIFAGGSTFVITTYSSDVFIGAT